MVRRTGFVELYNKWLIFLVSLFLFAPNNILFINKFIFIILVTMLFFILPFSKDTSLPLKDSGYRSNLLLMYLAIIIQFLLAEYSSRYYTGSGILDSFLNLVSGDSNYYKYQEYFAENELSSLSISKIPAILSNASIKGIFLISISSFVLTENKNFRHYFLFLSAIPPLLFSIARGTFFEVFEIFLCIIYFFKLMDYRVYKNINIKSMKKNLKIVLMSIFLLFLFVLNAGERYGDTGALYEATCTTKDFCFEPYTELLQLEYPVYFLSGYFSTGFFFLTEYTKLLLDGELINSMIPFASTSYFDMSESSLFRNICDYYIDCGVTWTPEIFTLISIFGFILFFPFFSLYLYYFFKIEKMLLLKFNIYSLPLCYFILLYIFSIPVGGFYTVSSTNIICSIVFFFLWIFKKKI